MRLRPFLVSLFSLCIVMGSAPSIASTGGRITGKVSSAKGGEALLGAVVTLFKDRPDGGLISFTRTDRLGSYVISDLSPGSYFLKVSREGFHPLTRANVTIDEKKTTSLNVILQEFLGFVSDDSDPRNWDVPTVMRSTSDRRLIFRNGQETGESPGELPGLADSRSEEGAEFSRNGTVHVASSAGLGSENYSVFPSDGRNGIISNFAFAEPIGDHSRMVFSGQLNSGYDSVWRIRNTYDYRPEPGRELKLSVGYGRLSLNGPLLGDVARPTQFFSNNSRLQETGAQTVVLGMESRQNLIDPIILEYGFDYSRVYYGTTKSILSPMFQVIVSPAERWTLRAGMRSRRVSENNLVTLPDGDTVNLMEPTYLAQIDGKLRLSQFKHGEIAVAREFEDGTSVEVALYEDHMEGPGTPFLMTSESRSGRRTSVVQLREDQAAHHGLRVSVNRHFLELLNGSIAYVYGTGARYNDPGASLPSTEALAQQMLNYIHRSYYHALTGQMDATIPRLKTHVGTIVRWYPGTSLSPIDLFYDRRDTLTKGVNFFVRQAIPVPDFIATMGKWEALVDVRNLFDQCKDRIRASDGELTLTRNPRSVRFGLNLNFY